jgi:hypothetical protein
MPVNLKSLAHDNKVFFDKAIGLLSDIKPGSKTGNQYYPYMFVYSIFNLIKSCNILMENEFIIKIPIFIRSIIEAIAKLSMIEKDKSMLNVFKLDSLKKAYSLLNENSTKDIFDGYNEILQESIKNYKDEIDDLKKLVSESVSISKIVGSLGIEYRVPYKLFCADVHNDTDLIQFNNQSNLTDKEIKLIELVLLKSIVDGVYYLKEYFPYISTEGYASLIKDRYLIMDHYFKHIE